LERFGSTNYLAEIGGEIVARGTKPGAVRWRVGLENPVPGGSAGPALQMPADAATAVITSGSYRHYLESGERRFGHIIDPRTGSAAEHALLSVTVVGRDATTTAAWGTALLCLGPADAAATAQRENLAAVMWIGNDAGSTTLELSPAFDTEWRGLLERAPSR
jgi:thiamine biosynthesis lipoprotein